MKCHFGNKIHYMIHFDVKINCIFLDLNKQLGHIFGMPFRYNSGGKKNWVTKGHNSRLPAPPLPWFVNVIVSNNKYILTRHHLECILLHWKGWKKKWTWKAINNFAMRCAHCDKET